MMHRAVCPWGYGYDKSMDLLLFFPCKRASSTTSFLGVWCPEAKVTEVTLTSKAQRHENPTPLFLGCHRRFAQKLLEEAVDPRKT